jgi:hypothetical protein
MAMRGRLGLFVASVRRRRYFKLHACVAGSLVGRGHHENRDSTWVRNTTLPALTLVVRERVPSGG